MFLMVVQFRTIDLLHSFLIKWSGKTRETRGQGDKGEIDGLGDQKTSVYLIVMSLKKLFMRIGLMIETDVLIQPVFSMLHPGCFMRKKNLPILSFF